MTDYRQLDAEYAHYKHLFETPTLRSLGVSCEDEDDRDSIYFCGNSLGLMPRSTRTAINDELNAWSARAVESHFNHPRRNATPWMDIDLPLVPLVAPLVGARASEVAVMGSLTANLNALLMSFYKPQGRKTKILFEKQAFPSDYYAFLNVVKMFGYDESHLVQLSVKPNATCLATEDILDAIDHHHDELALVLFPGVQYYTGQLFDIAQITKHAHKYDLRVGWDLAHAVGNVELRLHEWSVDFAAWCSYKYLNSGPGAIAGIFVHERFTRDNTRNNFTPRLAGWWGNNAADRFKMLEEFDPIQSALSYRQSNPSVIDVVALRSSLEIFQTIGGGDGVGGAMAALRKKSVRLTQYLQDRLTSSHYYLSNDAPADQFGFKILTPLTPNDRGAQLSVLFQPHVEDKSHNVMERVNSYLHENGIICDERRPDVIRFAPVPLYNTFEEVHQATSKLFEVLDDIAKDY